MDLTVTPSYGRDYTSVEKLMADWNANKDFTCVNGHTQINKQDAQPGMTIRFRYAKLKKVHVITIK